MSVKVEDECCRSVGEGGSVVGSEGGDMGVTQ